MDPFDRRAHGDRYYGMINLLSGKAQEQIIDFLNWAFENPETQKIFKLLLGCDDPGPVINELWKYYIWGLNPSKSLVFKEFVIQYIPLSIATNFQDKDSDLSRKALLVGNVELKKRPIQELDE